MNSFIARLDDLLQAKNSTRKELAQNCNFSYSAISTWGARGTIPAADVCVRIAKYLDTSVEYLVTGTDTYKEAFTQSDREHLAKWQKLTDTEQSVVSTTIDAMIATHSPADALNIDYERAQKNSPCALPKTLAKLVQERMVGWVIVRYGGVCFLGRDFVAWGIKKAVNTPLKSVPARYKLCYYPFIKTNKKSGKLYSALFKLGYTGLGLNQRLLPYQGNLCRLCR